MELIQLLTKAAPRSPWEACLRVAFLSSDQQARGTCRLGSPGSSLGSEQRLRSPLPHRTAAPPRRAASPRSPLKAPGQLPHQSPPAPPVELGQAPGGPACRPRLHRRLLPANLPSPSLLLPLCPLPRGCPPARLLRPRCLLSLTNSLSFRQVLHTHPPHHHLLLPCPSCPPAGFRAGQPISRLLLPPQLKAGTVCPPHRPPRLPLRPTRTP